MIIIMIYKENQSDSKYSLHC